MERYNLDVNILNISLYNHQKKFQGLLDTLPELQEGRYYHGCGVYTDKSNIKVNFIGLSNKTFHSSALVVDSPYNQYVIVFIHHVIRPMSLLVGPGGDHQQKFFKWAQINGSLQRHFLGDCIRLLLQV